MGALTSKPYAFRARPWELMIIHNFDFLDSFNSALYLHVRSGQIIRVLPRPILPGFDLWIMIGHDFS